MSYLASKRYTYVISKQVIASSFFVTTQSAASVKNLNHRA